MKSHPIEEVGMIISTAEGPTTEEYSFVVTGSTVRKGQFVVVPFSDALVVGVIVDMMRANRYFERAESVAAYQRENMMEQFPISEWEYVIALVHIFGVYRNGRMERNVMPPAPGQKVSLAPPDVISNFFGFDEKGLHVGTVSGHDVCVRLNLSKLFQKHVAILAMSGAGKSHLAGVLMEEILCRDAKKGNVAMVVIDVHGEYAGFKETSMGNAVTVVKGKTIRIALSKLSPSFLAEMLPNITSVALRDMTQIMEEMKTEMQASNELYGLDELIEKVEKSDMRANQKGPLLSWLYELQQLHLVGKGENPILSKILAPGTLTVIDLSDIDSQWKKNCIVAYIGKKLFSLRKKGKIPPVVFVVEEAHNFAREKTSREEAIAKHVIEKIAREGRKFGVALCLISQRPVHLSTTALSQCNTHIILRVTNPYDVDHIGKSSEGIDARMLREITTLRVGEALVVGEAVGHPLFVSIRDRTIKMPQRGLTLEEMARQFEEERRKREEDVEAFV